MFADDPPCVVFFGGVFHIGQGRAGLVLEGDLCDGVASGAVGQIAKARMIRVKFDDRTLIAAPQDRRICGVDLAQLDAERLFAGHRGTPET